MLKCAEEFNVTKLCLSSGSGEDNVCRYISGTTNNIHISWFNINHSRLSLLPTLLLEYPVSSIGRVSVFTRLSVSEWHQLACMISQSHSTVKELWVDDRDNLKTAETQDIITLWEYVQKWQDSLVIIDKSKDRVEQVLTMAGRR